METDKFELFWTSIIKSAENSNDEMTKSLAHIAPLFKGLVKEMWTRFLSKFEDLEKLTVSEMLSQTLKKFEESLKQDEQFLRDVSAKVIETVKPIQEIQDRNVQLEETLNQALNSLHETEEAHKKSLAKSEELISKLQADNESLRKLNEQYKNTITQLEKEVKNLQKELQDTREIAILRQFAINVEYELKVLILTQAGQRWNEQKILNTELYVLEEQFDISLIVKAITPWVQKNASQQQYEELKETLRWLKSYFNSLAHPVSDNSFFVFNSNVVDVDGRPVSSKDMKTIVANHIGKRQPIPSRTPFTLKSAEVLQIALNSVDILNAQRTHNNQTQLLYN